MGEERGNIASILFIQRIKFLFKLGQVFIIEPIEVVDATLLVEEAIGGVACQPYILLNGMLLVVWEVIVNTVGRGEIILCDDILPRLFRRPVEHGFIITKFHLLDIKLESLRFVTVAWIGPNLLCPPVDSGEQKQCGDDGLLDHKICQIIIVFG